MDVRPGRLDPLAVGQALDDVQPDPFALEDVLHRDDVVDGGVLGQGQLHQVTLAGRLGDRRVESSLDLRPELGGPPGVGFGDLPRGVGRRYGRGTAVWETELQLVFPAFPELERHR